MECKTEKKKLHKNLVNASGNAKKQKKERKKKGKLQRSEKYRGSGPLSSRTRWGGQTKVVQIGAAAFGFEKPAAGFVKLAYLSGFCNNGKRGVFFHSFEDRTAEFVAAQHAKIGGEVCFEIGLGQAKIGPKNQTVKTRTGIAFCGREREKFFKG